MSSAEVTCTRCGAGAKFTGPTAFADLVLWDKRHQEQCGQPTASAQTSAEDTDV